ncbi:MAG: hypothetical protein AB9846_09820 [Tenuifilaceae bacterium]
MKAESISIKSILPSLLFDMVAVAFIFLLPSISHLMGFAMYKLDPMRLALFSAILFTNRKNAYLIAMLLPFVSFIISAHPYFYKVFLISGELLLNVWLFYFVAEKFKNVFFASLISIIISKAVYYLFKYIFISFLLINDSLVSTSILIQIIVSVVLSVIMAFAFRREYSNK